MGRLTQVRQQFRLHGPANDAAAHEPRINVERVAALAGEDDADKPVTRESLPKLSRNFRYRCAKSGSAMNSRIATSECRRVVRLNWLVLPMSCTMRGRCNSSKGATSACICRLR